MNEGEGPMQTDNPARPRATLWDELDGAALVRGCSSGFTVLVLGGLVAPAAARLPVFGPYWLVVVAVVAFAVAGMRTGHAVRQATQGMCAAVGAYVLVLPLVLAGGASSTSAWQVAATLATAVVVGGAGGAISGLRRRGKART
ncbi:MAG TPA: hypothetical protein VJ870_12190 [Amycolatopsis sp.]|nr:hypothetical protein [Amycolatopsis sp.]